MTTIVTLKTHDWPVQVDTRQEHTHRSPERRGYGSRHDSEFVPAHTERSFTISQGAHVSFTELPKDATALPGYEDEPFNF